MSLLAGLAATRQKAQQRLSSLPRPLSMSSSVATCWPPPTPVPIASRSLDPAPLAWLPGCLAKLGSSLPLKAHSQPVVS